MRTVRPLLVATCLVVVGTVGLAVPVFAQGTPRQPRDPGGEPPDSGVQWLPGMNLQPTGTPERTTPPSPLPARARGTVAAPSATPTGAPTPAPTPERTVAPARTDAPVARSSSGLSLAPVLTILALALVTGLILLFRRRRRRQPDAPPPESPIAEPEPTAFVEPEPWPIVEPEADWSESPIIEPEPTPPTTGGSAESPALDTLVCENCGRENPGLPLFCDYCGQLLTLSKS